MLTLGQHTVLTLVWCVGVGRGHAFHHVDCPAPLVAPVQALYEPGSSISPLPLLVRCSGSGLGTRVKSVSTGGVRVTQMVMTCTSACVPKHNSL